MPLPRYTHALVRDPSPVYGAFYAARGISISDQLAHEQHEAYNDALREAGLKLVPIAPDPFLHDCVFIEDTAILWEKRALITRMNPLREGEQAAVRKWLGVNHFEIVTLPDDAKIEGGDVMHLEDETWVGLTERTNAAGVEALRQFLAPANRPVRAIPVQRCLHLKSAMTYLGNFTILTSPALIDIDIEPPYQRLDVPSDEAHAANIMRIGNTIISAANFPKTRPLLQTFAGQHRCKLVEVPISEFQKGDGAITCSSIPW